MVKLSGNLWIGDSTDESFGDLENRGITAILNVACDMQSIRGCVTDGIVSAQVGLIDGPGNPLVSYHTAVLCLATLLREHKVLVCCHTGSRSLAVAMMYLNLTNRLGWEGVEEILEEKLGYAISINEAHRDAY